MVRKYGAENIYWSQTRCTFLKAPGIKAISKDRLPEFATSMHISQLNCSCGANYMGRIILQVCHRIAELHPSWLCKGNIGVSKIYILVHLMDTGQQVDFKFLRLSAIFHRIYHIVYEFVCCILVKLLESMLTNLTFASK